MGIGGSRGGGCGATVRGGDGQLETVTYDMYIMIRLVSSYLKVLLGGLGFFF